MSDRETHIARAFEQLECADISPEARKVVEDLLSGAKVELLAVQPPIDHGPHDPTPLRGWKVTAGRKPTCPTCYGEGWIPVHIHMPGMGSYWDREPCPDCTGEAKGE